jgi:hypothetical protein
MGRSSAVSFLVKERADISDALQTAFAPSIFFNSVPKAPLHPGDQRIHTHMLLNVNLVKETTLRIPTREASKVSCRPTAMLMTGLAVRWCQRFR